MAKPKASAQKAEEDYLETVKRKATTAMDMLDAARRNAQTYQRYYDGDQWTTDEKRALEARGQPALSFNHIKPAVNAVIGIVERGRTDPKGWGRTPNDQQAAEVATDGLRYVSDVTRFNATARECLQDFLIWGLVAGVNELDEMGEPGIRRIRPEEFFYDPYSRDRDFGDARYMGVAKWMDEQDLIDLYPDQADKIKQSFDYATTGDTFKDRPRDGWSWIDVKSRRIMCFEMYSRRGAEWHKCVFVYGGVLEQGPSPYLDSKTGRPRNPIIAHSAYVDIDNCRYGIVKDMMPPQDAINKARSKAVHILNVAKLRVSKRLGDVDAIRREWAKPDGIIEAEQDEVEELGDRQLAPAHLELLRDAKEEMRRQSPTPGIVGRQGSAQSGRAILAEQQAGLTEQAPLLAGFDDWKLRCYRAMWESIKQFWKAPKWIRVTDDEMAPRFVGINVPQMVMDPMTGQPVQQIENNPAEMDVDIVIDSTPDTAVIQEEQFQRLAELVQAGMPIPPDVLIEASSLPKKKLLLDKLKQAQEQQAQQPDMAMQAEMQKAQMQAQAKEAQLQMDAQAHAQELEREAQADAAKLARQSEYERQKFEFDMQRLRAEAELEAIRNRQALEADAVKQRNALEAKAQEKALDLEHSSKQQEMMFVFDSRKHQQAIEAERGKGEALASAQAPAIEGLNAKLEKMGEMLVKLAKPKRLVKDPVTGEKRAEYVD